MICKECCALCEPHGLPLPTGGSGGRRCLPRLPRGSRPPSAVLGNVPAIEGLGFYQAGSRHMDLLPCPRKSLSVSEPLAPRHSHASLRTSLECLSVSPKSTLIQRTRIFLKTNTNKTPTPSPTMAKRNHGFLSPGATRLIDGIPCSAGAAFPVPDGF